jgi:hypothetical protein
MAELMTALNPLTGALYREGLEFTRLSREMFVVLAGKYPHPQTVVPGGVSSTVSMQTLNEYHSKLGRIFDYAHRMMAVWDDIPEFFYECDERYKQVGARPMNLIDPGYWDDPHAYDARYETCNQRPISDRPARQPDQPLPLVEQAHPAQAHRQELEGQVHLGVHPTLGSACGGGRRLRPPLYDRDGAEAPTQRLHRGDRPESADAGPQGVHARA